MKSQTKKNESGFTLLEYCAGAAVIITALYVGFEAMGGNIEALFNAIGGWATDRAGDIGS